MFETVPYGLGKQVDKLEDAGKVSGDAATILQGIIYGNEKTADKLNSHEKTNTQSSDVSGINNSSNEKDDSNNPD